MTVKTANELVARGHDVTIAVAFRAPMEEPYRISPNVKVVDFRTKRVRYFAAGLINLMRTDSFDVMFSATTIPNMTAVLSKKFTATRAPLVISERDNPHEAFRAITSAPERAIWRLKPFVYRRAQRIVCVSTPLAAAVSHLIHVPQSSISIIHNPAYPEGEFTNSAPPHEWLVNKPVPVVIAAGRMHPQKNFSFLVRAFKCVTQFRPSRLIILGDGDDRAAIESTIDACGLRGSVLLPGMQADIMPWLVHSDLFAMSSRFEGFGNVLVQALAAGLPIVSTDCPDGPREILANGQFGKLVPLDDTESFAKAIIDTLKEPPDAPLQMARAREFSVGRIVSQYEALFSTLAAAPR